MSDLDTNIAFGPYDLGLELGRGGAGVVYDATHRQLARQCALKMLHTRVSKPKSQRRFEDEGRLTARLGRHPNIVQIFDAGVIDDVPYLAMERVDGKSLSELLACDGRMNESVALEIGRHIALALGHAHSCGVVHRDVKPSNVIIDSLGEPRVLDFGLASDLTAEEVTGGLIVGTPAYLPPEQADARHGPVDHRADVYSLGVTLYQCLSGKLPFAGRTIRDTITQLLLDEPPHLTLLGVSPGSASVVHKAMERRPEDRYQTALDLADDLSRVISGAAPKHQPMTPALRAFHWLRRHQTVAVVAFTAALAALVLTGWFVYQRGEASLLWKSLANEMAGAAAEETRDFLGPALPVLRELKTLAEHNLLQTEPIDHLFKPLAARFLERSAFDWLGYGRADGEYAGIKRSTGGGALFNRSSATRGWMRETVVASRTLAQRPFRHASHGSTYDPTKRPFYSAAAQQDGEIWLDAYPFFEEGEGYGITAAIALRDQGNAASVRGVFHVDFKLDTLSRFLASLELGDGGQAYLLATGASGNPVIAGPQLRLHQPPPPIVAGALAALAGGMAALHPGTPQHVHYEADGVEYHAAFQAFDVVGGLKWVTLVAVPTATLGLSRAPLIYPLSTAGGLVVLVAGLWLIVRVRRRLRLRRRAIARAEHFRTLQQTASRIEDASETSGHADSIGV